MLDGNHVLKEALGSLAIDLTALVARTTLWAHPRVFEALKTQNQWGVSYPNVRRYRAGKGEKRGEIVDGIRMDDNTYANTAIKRAIGVRREVTNFMACHVWPDTCYDARYHTCIANLILLPNALAGLSDHDDATIRCLQYRAYELFAWYPQEAAQPVRPTCYPSHWREPIDPDE